MKYTEQTLSTKFFSALRVNFSFLVGIQNFSGYWQTKKGKNKEIWSFKSFSLGWMLLQSLNVLGEGCEGLRRHTGTRYRTFMYMTSVDPKKVFIFKCKKCCHRLIINLGCCWMIRIQIHQNTWIRIRVQIILTRNTAYNNVSTRWYGTVPYVSVGKGLAYTL